MIWRIIPWTTKESCVKDKQEEQEKEQEVCKTSGLACNHLVSLSPRTQLKHKIKKKKQVMNLVPFYQFQGAVVSSHSFANQNGSCSLVSSLVERGG